MNVQPGISTTPDHALDTKHSGDAPSVVTAATLTSAATASLVALDPEMENPVSVGAVTPNQPKSFPAKSPATSEQIAFIEAHHSGVAELLAKGEVKGKAVEAYVSGEGPASGISEAQAGRIQKLLAGPARELPTMEAPLVGEDTPLEPLTDLDLPETDVDPAEAWVNRDASPKAKAEMVRLLTRTDKPELAAITNSTLAAWTERGIVPRLIELDTLTNGQFAAVKAAAQSASIQVRAGQVVDQWDSMRPARGNFPAEPVHVSVGIHVKNEAKNFNLPSVIQEALLDPRIQSLLEASRNTAMAMAKDTKEALAKDPGTYKPSTFDYPPRLERAAQFALAKGGAEPSLDKIKADMTMALTAGTNRMLNHIAESEGVKDYRRAFPLRMESSLLPVPSSARTTPDWVTKPIKVEDILIVQKAVEKKGLEAMPESVRVRVQAGAPLSSLTQGDFASLRKAGYVPAANADAHAAVKTGFDGIRPATASVQTKIQDLIATKGIEALNATATSALSSEFLSKATRVVNGDHSVIFNQYDSMELRKKGLLE